MTNYLFFVTFNWGGIYFVSKENIIVYSIVSFDTWLILAGLVIYDLQ